MDADSRHFARSPARSLVAGLFALALGSLGPIFDSNLLLQPIRSPSPAYFSVSTDPRSVKPGGMAVVTVTVKLSDKPKSGADVHLAMLFTPGNDYRFIPDSGTTDTNGVFTAILKVSTRPGDSVIAATSGVFSDQAQVTSSGPGGNPTAITTTSQLVTSRIAFSVLLILGVVASGLAATMLYLRIRTKRSPA